MSDAKFIYGTEEELLLEVRSTLPGVDLDPTDFPTVEACLVPEGQTFNADSAAWTSGAWESLAGRDFVKVMLGATPLDVARGRYVAFVRLTGSGQTPILEARGAVVVG